MLPRGVQGKQVQDDILARRDMRGWYVDKTSRRNYTATMEITT